MSNTYVRVEGVLACPIRTCWLTGLLNSLELSNVFNVFAIPFVDTVLYLHINSDLFFVGKIVHQIADLICLD